MKVQRRKLTALALAALFLKLSSVVVSSLDNSNQGTRRERRFGVRPMNQKRATEGLFATLIKAMVVSEFDGEQFFKYTRMTKKQFASLVKLIKPHVRKDASKKPISIEHRLILTLHYLSEGSSMQEIAWNYRIGKTSARNIIVEMCQVLWNVLSPRELPTPTTDDFTRISTEFLQRWNIPNCIGAVDGKHVNLKAPKKSGSEFFNYKKTFSIVLMATCDAYYRFIMVDIGAPGSNHDGFIFKNSPFGQKLLTNSLGIPPPKPLVGTNIVMSHYLVADAAFPLHVNILRPYPGQTLGEEKNIFNYRLSRARRTIESAFGILSARWRILRKTLETSVDVSEVIIQATLVLHNYLQKSERNLPLTQRKYCPTGFADFVNDRGELMAGRWREEGNNLKSVNRLGRNNNTNCAKSQRDVLCHYFVSKEGWVSWQGNYVNRGGAPQ